MPESHTAFLSYAHQHEAWVRTLHANLERCLAHLGRPGTVFLDQVDLGAGRSWVGQLQAGLEKAGRLILVATPEALASPRVADEWETFIARRRDWRQGNLQVVLLIDAPLPPFLDGVQRVDFRRGGEAQYRRALQELLSGLLGHEDRRDLPALSPEIEIPAAPDPGLPKELRGRLVAWLAPAVRSRMRRLAVASGLRLESNALEGHPSPECAASAALVLATGKDDPVQGALRIVDVLAELVEEEEPERAAELTPLRAELEELRGAGPERGLLRVYLEAVDRDHAELVPYFQRQAELALLDRVYVQLELRPEERGFAAREGTGGGAPAAAGPAGAVGARPRRSIAGSPAAGQCSAIPAPARPRFSGTSRPPWRRRKGKSAPAPGAGLRIAAAPGPGARPLLNRLARRLERAGHPARGPEAVLDRAGQAGRLVLLFDGLDEVPKEERDEAERCCATSPPSGRPPRSSSPPVPSVITGSAMRPRAGPPPARRRPSPGVPCPLVRPACRRPRFRARRPRASGPRRRSRAAGAGRQPALPHSDGAAAGERDRADRNRTRLYDQVFELLLEGKHRPDGEPIDCQAGVREVLRHLGYGMTLDNRDTEPVTALEARLYQPEADRLREPLERVARWRTSLRPFLDDLSRKTGILGPHDGPDADWRFWHRTFREALAAERLSS